jgi:hypothetical protein
MGSGKHTIKVISPGYEMPSECPCCKANTVIFSGESTTPGVFEFTCGTCKARFMSIPEGVSVQETAPGMGGRLLKLIGGSLPSLKNLSYKRVALLVLVFVVGLFGQKLGIVIPGFNDKPDTPVVTPTPEKPVVKPPVTVPAEPAPTTPAPTVPAPPAPPAGENQAVPGPQETLGSQKRKTLFYKGETYVEVNFVDLSGPPAKSLADPGSDDLNPSYEKAIQDGRMLTAIVPGATPKSELYLKKSIWDTHKNTMAQHYP